MRLLDDDDDVGDDDDDDACSLYYCVVDQCGGCDEDEYGEQMERVERMEVMLRQWQQEWLSLDQ